VGQPTCDHRAIVVAVVGPTASGKSDVAVALAHRLPGGAEVVNADAMQLYRGMDVGTAKLTREEMRGVPHHLLDVLDVTETADVAGYQQQARDAFAAVRGRGRTPVLAGGSGLYVRAALDDLRFPGTDPAVRARLEQELAAPGSRYVRPALQVGLAVPRGQLDARIDARVRRMWDAGLVEEVERLARHGLREGLTASRALGYAQVLGALDGAGTLEEAAEATARLTRRFARKQESWFRRDPRVHWLDAPDGSDPDALAAAVVELLGAQERAVGSPA
jgi:tRNA dimethylallyltransferase